MVRQQRFKYPRQFIFLLFTIAFPFCQPHAYQAGITRTRKTSDSTDRTTLTQFSRSSNIKADDWTELSKTQGASGSLHVPSLSGKGEKDRETFTANEETNDQRDFGAAESDMTKQVNQGFLYDSGFRIWMFRQGSIPGHTAQFKFIPFGDTTQRIIVHGVEFHWPDLKKKLFLDQEDIFPISNTTDTNHYYLNVERCAYGRKFLSSGPRIFAVNHSCTKVFYFVTVPKAGWRQFRSVKYFKKQLKCSFKVMAE